MYNKSLNDIYFDSYYQKYYNTILIKYNSALNQSNNIEYAKFWFGFVLIISNYKRENPFAREVALIFHHNYNLGYSIDLLLSKIHEIKQKHKLVINEEVAKNTTSNYFYKSKFMRFFKLPSLKIEISHNGRYILGNELLIDSQNNSHIIKMLIRDLALKRFLCEHYGMNGSIFNLGEMLEFLLKHKDNPNPNSIQIQKTQNNIIRQKAKFNWIGKNKTEFVQLIYGIYHANLLTNENNEITKLVEDLSKEFDIDLGKNWQSNYSKSINYRNHDYFPEIFEKIKNGFIKYRDSR